MNPTFTDQVKAVMQYSREEAARLGHDYIGTEHLLLGIIKDGQGEAVRFLTRLGLNLDQTKQSIEDFVVTSGRAARLSSDIPFTSRAKQILDMATVEAEELESQCVGVEHLLLALLKDHEGVAAQVLDALGVNYQIARAELSEPGSIVKPNQRIGNQRVFILYYHPAAGTEGKGSEHTNVEELNGLLAEGWTISRKEDMGGRGAEGYFVSLLFLAKNK
jgi:ATP-dependent Clp protease ATP-binding subunit ClpA